MSSSPQQEDRKLSIHEIPPLYSPWSKVNLKTETYRNFFNPNICHWCKRKPKNSPFYSEDCNTHCSCNMILYCCNYHKSEHQANHKEICEILEKLSHSHPQFWKTRNSSQKNWIKSRKELLRLVKTELERDMKPYEMQMITFAKSCFVCHKQHDLQTCTQCYCVNYCSSHAEVLKNHHSSNCAKLNSCLEMDNYIRRSILPHGKFNRANFTSIHKVINIQQFIEKFTDSKCDYLHKSYSDYLSGPLTLYYGIMKGNFYIGSKHYVVHIIHANVLDAQYILAWEILLHVLRGVINHLEVVLIGSEMQSIYVNVELCWKCARYAWIWRIP
ncbi:uncharacterized protein LOC112589700 [Harpegnathos saltator]|uniref:uncharacterized protein LOC112589700 n=1 Tax=Harpegnathos saltator TaxID=610380 RepID=UPI000DBEE3CD|nr:uncharacterized protein LOC112589700 [Harpegnathos saltator]